MFYVSKPTTSVILFYTKDDTQKIVPQEPLNV